MRGGITAGIGASLSYLLMAHNGQLPFGVPLGLVFVAVAAFGIMDMFGSFDDAEGPGVAGATTSSALRLPLLLGALQLALFCGTIWGAQSGVGPQWMWGLGVTASFLFLVAAIFRIGVRLGPWAEDELGLARPLHERHGFWVIAAGALLYFPALGIFSLWDPWETHYGNVAREILARDDWISLWWAQEGWFWSKPILNFWMQSLAMATLGTHYEADRMLQGFHGAMAHPEWVVRTPNVLLTVVAMYLLYKGVAKVFGRRAGLIGALVLATMPDWFFLAHQTMADMPCVASMTAAMGLLLLGLHTDRERRVRLFEVRVAARTLRLSGWHLAFGAILICALPQILYLFSRNVELVLHGTGPFGFRPHWDEFRSGSAGNCGLPGNQACTLTAAASIPRSVGANPVGIGPQLLRTFGAYEPFLQATLWSGILGALLFVNREERRVQRLFYIGAWFFAAIATMGKGPMGFVIPMICAFAYVCTKKRWDELVHLEMLSGLLIILCVALPWYVAMFVRHGSPFTDRLIFYDMVNRALGHVHDTNEGDDTSFRFYIWQLGYALFPWVGFAPLGLMYWLRRSDAADQGRGDASVFLGMWFLFAFALFSFMGTKFHHYIFPAVPPAAMLIGVVVDDMLGTKGIAAKGRLAAYVVALGAGVALLVAGVARFVPGSLFGTKLDSAPGYFSGSAMLLLGLLVLAGGAGLLTRRSPDPPVQSLKQGQRSTHEGRMIGAAVVAGALVIALVGRDLLGGSAEQPGAIRLLQLFTYNYRRLWPETLDFSAPIAAFALVSIAIAMAMSVRAVRTHMAAAFLALAGLWAVWGLDVYMVKMSPHWGQREVIQAYYADRKGPQEPLVAYQMNWKGENFYTSNRIPAFVSTGTAFTSWMKTQREKGTRVMYFVTEPSRTAGMKGEVGGKGYRELTDPALCNKFVLVRAEL